MIEHSTIPTGDRHGIANWEFASYAARDAQAVSLADVGKVGHVVGKGHFALASVSPTVWEPMTSAEDIDLENVDNTADADKPVSTLQAAAISDSLQDAKDYADSQDVIVLDDAKDYADALATSALRDCGNFDASGGAYPATGGTGVAGAIMKGNMWRISVAGTLPSGVVVDIGDWIRALIDSPGNTQANWSVSEANLGYVPLRSINSRTAQDAEIIEYIMESLHKMAGPWTDCVEETGRSHFHVTATNGAVTYPPTTTGMTDATGIWRFTGTGASEGQFLVKSSSGSNKPFKLSAEPIVLVASFTMAPNLAEPYIGISLQANALIGDVSYGCDLQDGVHMVWKNHDSYLYYVTRSGGTSTGTANSTAGSTLPDTRYTFIIVATSTEIKYYLNGTLKYTHTANIPTVDLYACFFSADHGAAPFFGHTLNLDLFHVVRTYKTTPRSLGIPSVTY